MIFLAGLGLTASVISLLYLSQHLIASKSNEIDQQRSVLSVEGAVQTSVNRVLSLVLDNAIWDDAVTQTYAPSLDQKWLYDSWGSGFKINNLYDGTFVLDEHYRILWGAFQSQVLPRTDLSFRGWADQSDPLSCKALREGKNAFAGITRTEAGIALSASA
jgi:sensor domain CHASE-containing protein